MIQGAFLAAVNSVDTRASGLPATVRVIPAGAPGLVCGPLPVAEALRGAMADDRSGLFLCVGGPDGTGVVLCRADGTVGREGS